MTDSNERPRPGHRLDRRSFLTTLPGAAAGAALLPSALVQVARGQAGTDRDALVTIFLRGGLDGLSLVVPWGDPEYAVHRRDGASDLSVTPGHFLDDSHFFGLHPAASPLLTPFGEGRLAFVHQAGLKVNGTRSHFDAMGRVEAGAATATLPPTGWVTRVLEQLPPSSTGLRATALASLLPRLLAGAPQTLPIRNPGAYSFPAPPSLEALRRARLELVYGASGDPVLGPAGRTTLQAADQVEAVGAAGYTTHGAVPYPQTPFGQGLKDIAALLTSSEVTLEAAHIDLGDWDHHDTMGVLDGEFAALVANLASSLEAFYLDLQAAGVSYTLVAQSEFGRRIATNASEGTDHGKGGLMLVMGPGVNGGQVLPTSWRTATEADPLASPLHPENWDDGDLAVLIDHREVLAEICLDRLGLTPAQVESEVFPGFTLPATDWGVTAP